MDITTEQAKRARTGNLVLTGFAFVMFLGLALGPLLVLVQTLRVGQLVMAAFHLNPMP